MPQLIRNMDELLRHGNASGREVAIKIIECALNALNSYDATKKLVRVDKYGQLVVGNLCYDLSKINNIFVVGAGKATFPIAQALDEILGRRIKKGIIIVKAGEKRRLRHVEVMEAGHPVPDEAGLEGAKRIVSIAEEAEEGILCFVS